MAYSLLTIVMQELTSSNTIPSTTADKILMMIRLTFNVEDSRHLQCITQIMKVLNNNKTRFDPKGECFYNTATLLANLPK
jgi:hypothetical protein